MVWGFYSRSGGCLQSCFSIIKGAQRSTNALWHSVWVGMHIYECVCMCARVRMRACVRALPHTEQRSHQMSHLSPNWKFAGFG